MEGPGQGRELTLPNDLMARLFDGLDMRRQTGLDLFRSISRNQSHLSGLLLRIHHIQQALQLLRVHRRADLDTNRILDAPEILNMCAIDLSSSIADPDEMC